MTDLQLKSPALSGVKNTVYLIDASIYIFQAYFSPHVVIEDSNGEDLSALFGFTQFLIQFLRRMKPSHVAIARDESLQTGFRHRLCPDYKSNRELPDENLKRQLDGCGEIARALGLADYASTEYEADDIIGTLAFKTKDWLGESDEVCVVSKDKDLAQLLFDSRVFLWDYSSNRKRNRDDIESEFGILPEQIPDYLGLIGDSVDMISGVPSIGPVKAKALLNQYDSIENVYRNLDELSLLATRGANKLADSIRPHQALALLCKQLASIKCNVADEAENFASARLEDLECGPLNASEFQGVLNSMNFREYDRNRLCSQLDQLESALSVV